MNDIVDDVELQRVAQDPSSSTWHLATAAMIIAQVLS